jgi:hypothetical protein
MRYRKPTNNHEALVLALDIFMRVDEDDEDGRSKAYCMLDYFFDQMTEEEINAAEMAGDYKKS